MSRPHRFTRQAVATARQKVREGENYYRLPEPPNPLEILLWRPEARPDSATSLMDRAWHVGDILAKDHEELEAIGTKTIAALQLLDDMTTTCPVCGGRPLEFGPLAPIIEARAGVRLESKHSPGCPFLEVWQAMVRRIHGNEEAAKVNKLVTREAQS